MDARYVRGGVIKDIKEENKCKKSLQNNKQYY